MWDTGITLYLFFARFTSAFELKVGDFTMAQNKSAALMFIDFNRSIKYLKTKKIRIEWRASKSDLPKFLL